MLAVVYCVGVNAFLLAGGASWVFNKAAPDMMRMSYSRAWTLWPYRIHIRDLKLSFQDDNIQFYLHVPKGWADVSIADLRLPRFHATKVKVEGVEFRLRHKLAHLQANARRLQAYPEIPWFPGSPIFKMGPIPIPRTPEELKKLVGIHLENVTADVRVIWFMEYRYEGKGSVKGAFLFLPLRWLWVDAPDFRLGPGEVTVPPEDAAHIDHAQIALKVHPYNPHQPLTLSVFKNVSVDAKLDAQTHSLDFVRMYINAPALQHIQAAKGKLHVDLGIVHGRLSRTSDIHFKNPKLDLRFPTVLATTDLDFDLAHRQGSKEVTLQSFIKHAAASAREAPAAAPLLTIDELQTKLDVATLGLTDPIRPTGFKATLAHAHSSNLRWLNDLIPPESKLHISGGTLDAAGNIAHDHKSNAISGRLRMQIRDAAVVREDIRTKFHARLQTAVAGHDPRDAEANLEKAALLLDDVTFASATQRIEHWRARIDSTNIKLQTASPSYVDANLHITATSGDPLRLVLDQAGGAAKFFGSIANLNGLTADLRLHFDPLVKFMDVKQFSAGMISAVGSAIQSDDRTRAAFLIKTGPISVGIHRQNNQTHVEPMRTESWLKANRPVITTR